MKKYVIASDTQYYDRIEESFTDNPDFDNGYDSLEDAELALERLTDNPDWCDKFKESLWICESLDN